MKRNFKIGIHQYDILIKQWSEDYSDIIKYLAETGYECVELNVGQRSTLLKKYKSVMDTYGITIPTIHDFYNQLLFRSDKELEALKSLGIDYMSIPYISPDEWTTNYDGLIKTLTEIGTKLKNFGIKLCYHNHDFEFKMKRGDKLLIHSIMDDIPKDLLQLELDVCMCSYTGHDPVEYMEKYADRCDIVHLKDYVLQTPTGDMYENRIVMDRNADGFRFCPVGEGLVDFKPIFAAAQKYNVKYLIVMLEQHYGTSELENAKTSMKNIKTLLDE